MSFMHMDALTAATEEPTVVTLSGATASDNDPFFARAGFIFRTDGTVDRVLHFSEVQTSASTDWIIPNSEASVDYQIRCHRVSGNTPGPSATEVFLTLDTEREWVTSCDRFCVESSTLIIDIRFQDGSDTGINNVSSLFDGANVMATNNYSIFIEAN